MTDIVIKADTTIKMLLAAIIMLGGVVWADLHFQSVNATDAANLAAFNSAKLLGEIKDSLNDQEHRIDSLERIVYGGIGPRSNGNGVGGPFRGRGRTGGPFSVPHKQAEPKDPPHDPPATPKQDQKAEPPDEAEILETDG